MQYSRGKMIGVVSSVMGDGIVGAGFVSIWNWNTFMEQAMRLEDYFIR